MASTLKLKDDGILWVKEIIKSLPIDRDPPRIRIIDSCLKIMWLAAPWRWAIGTIPPIPLIDQTATYAFTEPSDFLSIKYAVLVTPGDEVIEIEPAPILHASTAKKGNPSKISRDSAGVFRLWPVPAYQSADLPTLFVWYQKTSPLITTANENTGGVQLFDDEYFPVFKEFLLWEGYRYAEDARAGGVQIQNGEIVYTGQLAVAMAALERMKQLEPQVVSPVGVRET